MGGGGLGSVITTGIRQEDMQAILGGTGVLMAAALVLDLLMGMAERYLNSRDSQRPRGRRMAAPGSCRPLLCGGPGSVRVRLPAQEHRRPAPL